MLTVDHLTKTYPGGRRALCDVSFSLSAGERVILLGPNGAGKTTLIKCILGLVRPDSGRVILNGRDILKDPNYGKEQIAVLFEEADNSYAYLTVYENLVYFALLNGIDPRHVRSRADSILQLVGLSDRARCLAQSLSRGMKQKLGVAIALIKDAPLLFLDEPTLGLDVESQHHMRLLLVDKSLSRRAILITTHDINFAYAVGTRFLFIKNGTLIGNLIKAEISNASDLEKLFLAAVASSK